METSRKDQTLNIKENAEPGDEFGFDEMYNDR
jgi:hypothetical protein